MDKTIDDVASFLEKLASRDFFGSIELIFKRGRIALVKTTETVEPQDLANRMDRGAADAHQSRS